MDGAVKRMGLSDVAGGVSAHRGQGRRTNPIIHLQDDRARAAGGVTGTGSEWPDGRDEAGGGGPGPRKCLTESCRSGANVSRSQWWHLGWFEKWIPNPSIINTARLLRWLCQNDSHVAKDPAEQLGTGGWCFVTA